MVIPYSMFPPVFLEKDSRTWEVPIMWDSGKAEPHMATLPTFILHK